MNFREMQPSDIEQLKDKSISRGILHKMPAQIEFSYCLEYEGEVLSIGGIQMVNETTAWGWINLSEDAVNFKKTVYKVINDWTEKLTKDKGIKRLQVYVECDFPKAVRLVEHLGFARESIMPRFVGEKSAYLYVKHYGD